MDELDPLQRVHLDALAEEYTRRHGAAVEFIKRQIGEGDMYANSVARAMITENGAWFECIDLPMEFTGAAGAAITHRFVKEHQANEALDKLAALCERAEKDPSIREAGLFVLYKNTGVVDEREAYVYQFKRTGEPVTRRPQCWGAYRSGELPLAFRGRFHLETEKDGMPFLRGVVFCLANIGEMNLLVEIPYEADQMHDLSTGHGESIAQ